MARLRRKGLGATELVRDNDGAKMPIMHWGAVHTLAPTETTPARKSVVLTDKGSDRASRLKQRLTRLLGAEA